MNASSGDPLAFDDAAEDIGVVAVDPRLARLRDERQRAETLHRVADRLALVGGVPAEASRRAQALRLVHRGDVAIGAVRDAGGMRQEIADGDRPPGWDDLRRRARRRSIVPDRHLRVRKARDVAAHRIVERELAFLQQHQHRGAGNRLGLRGDAEDRGRRHPPPRFLVAPADRFLVGGLAIAKYERDCAGQPVFVDVLLQHGVDARQPLGREGGRRRRGVLRLAGRAGSPASIGDGQEREGDDERG